VDRAKPLLYGSAYALYAHFALQLVAGGLLATVYRGSASEAHATTATLHQGAWAILQGFHYWGSFVLIIHSVLHLGAVTWAGWYAGKEKKGYFTALILAGLALGFQVSGNALSWDRHGVQTAAVEGAIANRIPVMGAMASKTMLGGTELSDKTLPLWYDAHRIGLAIVLVVALIIGLQLPKQKVPTWTVALSALAALALAVLLAAPFGTAATPDDYGRFDAKPSWYTAPMHGLLVWGDRLMTGGGWIGAALVPGLIGAAMVGLGFLKKPKPAVARGLLAGFALLGLLATITSGGEVASLTGTRDPKVRVAAVPPAVAQVQDKVMAAKGKALFAAQGCAGCHGQDGLKGTTGPSLKDLWKEQPEASYYERYVKNPASVQPGSTMPAYSNLKQEELRQLAEFLRFAR